MPDASIDQAKFLGSFEEFLDIVVKVFQAAPLQTTLGQHHLVLVGGQAIAFWYVRYLLAERDFTDFQFAYTDDLDFYGVKSGVAYCEDALGIAFRRPGNFDSTVNLGMASYTLPKSGRKVIIDVISSVGGLDNREPVLGARLLEVDGIGIPVISPLLCLRSRINNFYAPYKADKPNELGRIRMCLRLIHCYLNEALDEGGWSKEVSADFEAIIAMCLSNSGRKLFCKNAVDLMSALPIRHEKVPAAFVSARLPRARKQIRDERERMRVHLERFDKTFTGQPTEFP